MFSLEVLQSYFLKEIMLILEIFRLLHDISVIHNILNISTLIKEYSL